MSQETQRGALYQPRGVEWGDIYIYISLLLLLLSCFSCVRPCATPETAAHQAPPSLGFSRQEHWSGLPFPSPMHESEKQNKVFENGISRVLRFPHKGTWFSGRKKEIGGLQVQIGMFIKANRLCKL